MRANDVAKKINKNKKYGREGRQEERTEVVLMCRKKKKPF